MDRIESYGFTRVKSWTRQEISDLQKNSQYPICIALSNGNFLVATYLIEKISDHCWYVNNNDFTEKRSAIFYCALLHLNKIIEAETLLKLDRIVSKLDLDKLLYRARLDNAHINNDEFKISLYSSRYSTCSDSLKLYRRELLSYLEIVKKYVIIK
jgi:hypothetical protein